MMYLTTNTEFGEERLILIQITFWSIRYYENNTYDGILSTYM